VFPLFATGVVDTGGKFAAGVVDTVPVVHLDLQISPRAWVKWFTKKTRSIKSRDTVPLTGIFCIGGEGILTVFSSTSFSILIYTHGAHWAIILLIDQARFYFETGRQGCAILSCCMCLVLGA
jgi:hypothetical protein